MVIVFKKIYILRKFLKIFWQIHISAVCSGSPCKIFIFALTLRIFVKFSVLSIYINFQLYIQTHIRKTVTIPKSRNFCCLRISKLQNTSANDSCANVRTKVHVAYRHICCKILIHDQLQRSTAVDSEPSAVHLWEQHDWTSTLARQWDFS